MNNSKLDTTQAIAFIVIIILNHIVLNLPNTLSDQCGSSFLSFCRFMLWLNFCGFFRWN